MIIASNAHQAWLLFGYGNLWPSRYFKIQPMRIETVFLVFVEWKLTSRNNVVNVSSGVEVRFYAGGVGVRGGDLISDWTKMQDGRWKAAF